MEIICSKSEFVLMIENCVSSTKNGRCSACPLYEECTGDITGKLCEMITITVKED